MTLFVFLSYQRGASWSRRRKPGLDWQQFIRWEKQLNTFQEIVNLCRVCTDDGQKLFNMLLITLSFWNFSWSSRSKYSRHSSLVCNFPAHRIPLQWVPCLIWVLDHTPDIFYLMCCDKLDVNLYLTKLITLLPLCAPA